MELLLNIIKSPFICIGWIIIGAVAGTLANQIMKSRAPLINDIITGWVGALVGGMVMSLLNINTPAFGLQAFCANIAVATLGAVLLIAALRALRGQPG